MPTDVHEDVLAPAEVLGIAGEADPAEGADAAREDRAHVLGDEAGDLRRAGQALRRGLRADPVSVLEDDRAALLEAEQRGDVRGERVVDRALEGRVLRVCRARLVRREAEGHVAAERIVRRRLVGYDVELDPVGEQARDDLRRVADERDRGRAIGIEMRGERVVVAGDEVDPAVRQAPLGAGGIDLDDERAASVQPDAEPLRAAHAAEPGGQHAPAGERAAEVLRRDRAEGLVGEAEDALRADVEPAGGGHLAVHRQPRVLEPAEGVLVGPLRDDHRCRDEDTRRVLVGRKHGHRLARLDDQCLVGAEALEGGDDAGQVFLGARRLASTSVDDERVGILGDARVEVVEEAAERAFLLPAAAAQAAQAAMSGKSTRKEAPPPGLSSTQARPPCSAANCATSERPDADPGRLDLAAAREGLEDRLLLGVGHAGAVVVHAQERTGSVGRDRHLDGRARGGVALGVGDEVLHDALELGRVDARVDALGLHVDLPAVGPACDDAADELGEVGVLEVDT